MAEERYAQTAWDLYVITSLFTLITIDSHFCSQGKTLTMLALILATKLDLPVDYSRSTLIGTWSSNFVYLTLRQALVVPPSVLSNWEKQIQDHVVDGSITYCVYYGAGRSMSASELKQYDVVITTYQTVVQERGIVKGDSQPTKKKKMTERI